MNPLRDLVCIKIIGRAGAPWPHHYWKCLVLKTGPHVKGVTKDDTVLVWGFFESGELLFVEEKNIACTIDGDVIR